MIKRLRKVLIFSLFFFLFFSKVNAFEVVNPTLEFYVNDYANVITDTQKEEFISRSEKLYNNKGVQIVVLTINGLNNVPIEDYANKYYNDNGIGSEINSGILILLSVDDRAIRVEVGDHLEGLLPDGKVGSLIDEQINIFKNGNWNEGLTNLYQEIYTIINNADLSEYVISREEIIGNQISKYEYIAAIVLSLLAYPFIKICIVLFIIIVIIGLIIRLICDVGISFTHIYFLTIFYAILSLISYILHKANWYTTFGSGHHSSGSSYHSGHYSSGGGGHSSGGGASRRF